MQMYICLSGNKSMLYKHKKHNRGVNSVWGNKKKSYLFSQLNRHRMPRNGCPDASQKYYAVSGACTHCTWRLVGETSWLLMARVSAWVDAEAGVSGALLPTGRIQAQIRSCDSVEDDWGSPSWHRFWKCRSSSADNWCRAHTELSST